MVRSDVGRLSEYEGDPGGGVRNLTTVAGDLRPPTELE